MLATFTVNSLIDPSVFSDADTDVSLREAIFRAENTPGADIINFSTDPVHNLNGATIKLQYIDQFNAAFSIYTDVTIDATMLPQGITLDAIETEIDPTVPGGQDGLRVFDLGGPETFNLSVTLAGLKITGGDPIFGGAGAIAYQAESGVLTIRDCKIFGNFGFGEGAVSASVGSIGTANGVRIERTEISDNSLEPTGSSNNNSGAGAAIAVGRGFIDIVDTTISGNHNFVGKGGGLYIFTSGNASAPTTATIRNSTITGNTSQMAGGGFFAYFHGTPADKLTVLNSTISGNHALTGVGGGGYACTKSGGQFEVINSTFSDNEALDPGTGRGGGLAISRQTLDAFSSIVSTLNHLTITDNRATNGGGLFSFEDPLIETFVNNTIISGNLDAAEQHNNVAGKIENDSHYNLLGTGGGADLTMLPADNLPGIDNPLLGPLVYNGGPVFLDGSQMLTHALLPGSPAIDAGNPSAVAGIGGVPEFDQRGEGFSRVLDVPGVNGSNARIDIGAYEVGLAKVVDVRLDNPTWDRDSYSFAEVVPAGKQLDSLFTAGVNSIEVVFSEAVTVVESDFVLLDSGGPIDHSSFVPGTHSATWTYAAPLGADKYAFVQTGAVTDLYLRSLDGDWDEPVDPMDVLAGPGDTGPDWTGKPAMPFSPGNGSPGGNFRLHFAYLPGDYNQDGIVLNYGPTSDLLTSADGDGDGLSGEPGDEDVIANAISTWRTSLVASRFSGDYNDNEGVALMDYEVWKFTYGSTTDLRADGNGDQIVDAADYLIWRDNLGGASAWSALFGGGSGSGSGTPVFDPDNVPRVANVTISGSTSTHAPYSFDGHDGSGEQLRTVPVGGADTISITFTEDVNIVSSDLRVTGLRTAIRPTLAGFSYDVGTMTATWRFTSWNNRDRYLVSLSDAVTDVEGNALDGEWTNPASLSTINSAVSEFPSGDGTAGGDFSFVVTLISGDTDLDGDIDAVDAQTVTANLWMTGAQFVDGDQNGNGTIDYGDYFAIIYGVGTSAGPVSLLADLNGDWVVDESDANILSANSNLANPTQADGDLDGNGVIDIHDLDTMFAQFGLELSVVS